MAVNAKTTPVGDILVASGRTLAQLNTLVDTNTSDIDALEAAAPVAATETAAGIVELATNVEAVAGTDTTRAVTPAGVAAAAPNVTLSGTPDYITISGQTVTRNQIDLAADVTGALPIAGISATGTPGVSTYLRGDGTWAEPPGGGEPATSAVVDSIAAMTAIASPTAGQMVTVRGYYTPGDGGGGMFSWIADSNAIADTGTVIEQESGGTGRWLRLFEPGTINAKWFATEDALLSYCTSQRPLTVMFPPGVYNFANKIIPAGIHLVGPGWLWSGGQPYGGFGLKSAVLIGPIRQGQGPSGGSFKQLVISGGLSIEKQYVTVTDCAFTGEGGTLSFDYSLPSSPYYNFISGCLFRGITGGPCVFLKGQANANRFLGCSFQIGMNERGIVAEYSGDGPLFNSFIGCSLEKGSGITTIGSYLYGAFKNSIFMGSYVDSAVPTFQDGAAYVFDGYSRNNRVFLSHNMNSSESILDSGQGNVFSSPVDKRLIGINGYNLGTLSGIPDLYVLTSSVDNVTLPEIGRCNSSSFRIIAQRSPGGATIYPNINQTINNQTSLALEANTPYTFYTLHSGVAVTDWKAVSG